MGTPGPNGPNAQPLSDEEFVYFLDFAASTIQRYWRGYRVRKWYLEQKAAAEALKESWAHARREAQKLDAAARIIQAAWEGFRNKRIYQYYRDLIQFRERGDPREMLRSINPREAALIDAAAGIHVRFRLGGTMFPPLVFYKIFTHRPVTDINAFGPRNYAGEVSVTAKQRHNKPKRTFEPEFEIAQSLREYIKPDGTIGYRSTTGWYERAENNGWRPVSERVLLDEDPVTTMTKLKRTPLFHYNPAVRREERVRRAKAKKREWMLRLYQQGLTTGQADGGTAHLPGSDLADLDEKDLDDLDPQVDELLQWSQHLDFNNYLSDWTSLACTLASEAFVPENEADFMASSTVPPPCVDVRAAMAAAGVPLQPFKSGVGPAGGATSGVNLC